MSDTIIRVENLGKKYQLGRNTGQDGARYRTLRDDLMEVPRRLASRLAVGNRKSKIENDSEFWALRDVNFEVEPGEVVGIIGRNGAGKSTLLKILSRITEPTTGKIHIKGRVASLLEVGTGFHPELTGRENIFLNGAILGMSRAEIKAKFDEIVAFAEVERFLATPVKRYSSGMYVRLAFAVAAHLDPEILIVDEVLAVGDASFQRKCLGKMEQVSRTENRTVLFVSHNMGAVNQLCHRVALLDSGQVAAVGSASSITARYYGHNDTAALERSWPDIATAPGDAVVKLANVKLLPQEVPTGPGSVDVRHPIGIEVRYTVLTDGAIFVPSLHLHNSEGIQVFLSIDLEPEWSDTPRRSGSYTSTARIPGNFLNTGMHYISVALSRLDVHTLHLFERHVIAFNVVDMGDADTARGAFSGGLPGVIRPILQWITRPAVKH